MQMQGAMSIFGVNLKPIMTLNEGIRVLNTKGKAAISI